MNHLINTFIERRSDWVVALIEHLQISLIALIVAIFIAIPIAILISNNKKISELAIQFAGILQTIPSLALLGLFIPLLGIGTLPAVVVLIIYAIFPILQNTITGLNEIDPSLQEAATAFGMTKFEKLKKFEIEIAMPVIISGVRTSAVLIIGTATLAALIGAGGLGSFILLGIDRNNSSLILIGAISSAILAIVFGGVIKFLEKRNLKTVISVLLVTIILLTFSFISVGGVAGDSLVIAGKMGSEPEILINMYKLLIEEESDIEVVVRPNFGKTTFLYEALRSKEIDIYPEFTGTVLTSLLTGVPEFSNDPEEAYNIAKEEIYNQDNLVLLEPMAFQNTYALTVKRDFSDEHNLETISDLAAVESFAVAGFTLEFSDREDGNIGLQNLYGLNLDVRTMEPALRYQAIENDEVQIIDGYSTDSDIRRYDLVILEDNLNLFPPYQGAPLLREETLEEYPELGEILNNLSGLITEEEMIDMNYEVDVNERLASDVAREFLEEKGLISEEE